jgi:hypothetical protein
MLYFETSVNSGENVDVFHALVEIIIAKNKILEKNSHKLENTQKKAQEQPTNTPNSRPRSDCIICLQLSSGWDIYVNVN